MSCTSRSNNWNGGSLSSYYKENFVTLFNYISFPLPNSLNSQSYLLPDFDNDFVWDRTQLICKDITKVHLSIFKCVPARSNLIIFTVTFPHRKEMFEVLILSS